jgi:DNA-directed RNA polymerase specialized sigma24 family protein
MKHMVDLLMAYSKRPDLLFDLARAVERLCGAGVDEPGGVRSVRSEQAPRVWRVRDRLSEADIRSLISRYQEGVTARELAEYFNIGMTSVKRLLRKPPA